MIRTAIEVVRALPAGLAEMARAKGDRIRTAVYAHRAEMETNGFDPNSPRVLRCGASDLAVVDLFDAIADMLASCPWPSATPSGRKVG